MKHSILCTTLAIAGLSFFAGSSTIAATTATNDSGPSSVTVPVPKGADGVSYKVYDHDGWWNPDDLLEDSEEQPITPESGGHVEIKLGNLKCEDGEVAGPAGSSGEETAEVYVLVTFHFPGGGTTTSESEIQKVSCDDLKKK